MGRCGAASIPRSPLSNFMFSARQIDTAGDKGKETAKNSGGHGIYGKFYGSDTI
jgi:hypothetical protein